jgi:predicted acylesterase/phospholipase RssA
MGNFYSKNIIGKFIDQDRIPRQPKDHSHKQKKALVLSGGGAFGSYQVGVLKHLAKISCWEEVFGISVGAINGSFLSMFPLGHEEQAVEQLEEFWKLIDTKDI